MSRKDLIVLNIFVFLLLIAYQLDNYDIIFAVMFFILVFYVVSFFRLNSFLKKETENQKQYFIDTLIHDLKTPTLAQLRGLEIIQNESIGNINETQKEIIGEIEKSCKYSLDMISMVLNTYRFETGQNKLYYETFNIVDILQACFDENLSFAKEKNITFSYNLEQTDTNIEADKCEIKTVISNLISQAIIYSNKDEKINVNISTNNNNLNFTIESKGITFSAQECLTMFDKESVQNYTTIGHKIKLHLCKKIINGHCGEIYATSDGIATSAIVFEIPMTRKTQTQKIFSPSFI